MACPRSLSDVFKLLNYIDKKPVNNYVNSDRGRYRFNKTKHKLNYNLGAKSKLVMCDKQTETYDY